MLFIKGIYLLLSQLLTPLMPGKFSTEEELSESITCCDLQQSYGLTMRFEKTSIFIRSHRISV